MKTGGWILVLAGAAMAAEVAATLTACASESEPAVGPPASSDTPVPSTDGGTDAAEGGDASICKVDCEFYPDECTDDALCAGGPFAPGAVGGSLDLRTHVHALAGRAPNDGWLVGTVGGAAHFDGASWTRVAMDTTYSLYGLWLLDDAEVAFDDPRRLRTRGLDAGADSSVSRDGWSLYGSAKLPALWGVSNRVLAAWSYPGTHSLWMSTARSNAGFSGVLSRMRYTPSDGQFVVSELPRDCTRVPCTPVTAIGGVSANEIWTAGERGAVVRITDAESDTPTQTDIRSDTIYALYGIWAAASDDVWIVGATGTVRRYRGDGRALERYDAVPTKQRLNAVAGASPSDIWIVGDEGTVFHYDGKAWQRMKVAGLGGRRPRLDRIWIPSPGKVWIAGQGTLLSIGGKP